MARRRRRYPPYDPRYDPRYDPYAYRQAGYGPGYGYYRPGNSCLRDACLLQTGCCVAESLDGGCLVASVLLLPQFARALSTGGALPVARRPRVPVAARLVAAVRVYQREISASRAPVCRFTPSCSEYAVQAVERHGALRGTLLAARRLLRCRPGGARGADPVPQ